MHPTKAIGTSGHRSSTLLQKMVLIETRIEELKMRVKDFYFDALVMRFRCPLCAAKPRAVGENRWSCACGNVFDPTVVFQRSNCCQAILVRRVFHYACTSCGRTIRSRFLFDERVFDRLYFQEMMRKSRDRRSHRRKQLVRHLMAEARSGILPLLDEPSIEAIPGLLIDLDEFVASETMASLECDFDDRDGFDLPSHRLRILSMLGWRRILFSQIPLLQEDLRLSKARLFMTLLFMASDREVELSQYGEDVQVERVFHEAHS